MHNWLLTRKLAENKKKNHSSVTFACEQTACFITLGCEQQSVSFPALLIRNQGVNLKLWHSRLESQKIETVTSFGVAQRHLLFRVLLCVLDYNFPASWKFFLDFSAAELLRYNESLDRIKTESTNLTKHDNSLSANSMVYHNGVIATLCDISGLSH